MRLGGICDYCPESPKESGGFSKMADQRNSSLICQLNAAGGRTDRRTHLFFVRKCPHCISP